jgi:hypothetical protein
MAKSAVASSSDGPSAMLGLAPSRSRTCSPVSPTSSRSPTTRVSHAGFRARLRPQLRLRQGRGALLRQRVRPAEGRWLHGLTSRRDTCDLRGGVRPTRRSSCVAGRGGHRTRGARACRGRLPAGQVPGVDWCGLPRHLPAVARAVPRPSRRRPSCRRVRSAGPRNSARSPEQPAATSMWVCSLPMVRPSPTCACCPRRPLTRSGPSERA